MISDVPFDVAMLTDDADEQAYLLFLDIVCRAGGDAARDINDPEVYFIRGEGSGRIKIGVSEDAACRLPHLQVGSPVPLELLATSPGGYRLEKALHRHFKRWWSHGEWYLETQHLLRCIRVLPRVMARYAVLLAPRPVDVFAAAKEMAASRVRR